MLKVDLQVVAGLSGRPVSYLKAKVTKSKNALSVSNDNDAHLLLGPIPQHVKNHAPEGRSERIPSQGNKWSIE